VPVNAVTVAALCNNSSGRNMMKSKEMRRIAFGQGAIHSS
jgi:hypothetical protein